MAKDEKRKKPFYKRWWFWLLILVVIIALFTGGDDETSQNETADQQVEQNNNGNNGTTEEEETNNDEQLADEEASDEAASPNISEEEFDQLQNGMTYDEAVSVIGGEGEVMSETGEKGTEYHTIIYSWEGEAGWGSNAILTFQNDKLVNKSQAGLGNNDSGITVTMDEFDQIKNGMTCGEVAEIIGGEGEVLSESGEKGTGSYTVIYQYNGEGDIGANANFTFQGDKLMNKAQFGLK